jgi:hypothetical protein
MAKFISSLMLSKSSLFKQSSLKKFKTQTLVAVSKTFLLQMKASSVSGNFTPS